jgi:hypothetical protein
VGTDNPPSVAVGVLTAAAEPAAVIGTVSGVAVTVFTNRWYAVSAAAKSALKDIPIDTTRLMLPASIQRERTPGGVLRLLVGSAHPRLL